MVLDRSGLGPIIGNDGDDMPNAKGRSPEQLLNVRWDSDKPPDLNHFHPSLNIHRLSSCIGLARIAGID
jgi:hypothetical protein